MSALNNSLLLGQEGGGGYSISRSLRFNAADSSFLSRTPASAGNRKTWTWAGWAKRSGLGRYAFFSAGSTTAASFGIEFDSSNCLWAYNYTSAFDWQLVTTPVYRDASAWYHIVISVDTTQGTAANRVRVYVNGVQVTAFSTATYPSSNSDTYVNTAAIHTLGCYQNQSLFANLYLADIHFIDGQALDPTSFGEFDANGIWQPIEYTGTYGTNGFHLDFSDNSTAAGLGTDTSGNGNTWSVNNISVTAGAGNDSLVDVPTNGAQTDTGVGGEVRGNYCTFNPLRNVIYPATVSNGNLELSVVSGYLTGAGTLAVTTGKWYWEMTLLQRDTSSPNYQWTGVVRSDNYTSAAERIFTGTDPAGVQYWGDTGKLNNTQAYGASFTTNDIIGAAFDVSAGSITFYKNGVSQGASTFNLVPNASYYPSAGGGVDFKWAANFGQRPFAYTAPSGFKALCTANLPAPVVTKPSTVMDVKLYTGNGSTQTISGLGFSPDFVWLKKRNGATSHRLFDVVRGATKNLYSNTTDAEGTDSTSLSSFDSTGFSLGDNGAVNALNDTYAAWAWDAGSATVTNTQGSISSQVRANASAGFSIVTYTGTGANATVGHGLGVAPQMIIVKSRGSVTNWGVGHTSIGWANALRLNTTDASSAQATFWNSTAPTSTVFSVGTGPSTNNNGDSIVAYCFAPVAGYSAFGSYTGNGSADGPFVWTGHRVRWLLIKHSSASGDNWWLLDSAREEYNDGNRTVLFPNTSGAEVTDANPVDFLSNGFKPRNSGSGTNASGETYIYAAFAESPFQYARAR
jgi:hypothetical protein